MIGERRFETPFRRISKNMEHILNSETSSFRSDQVNIRPKAGFHGRNFRSHLIFSPIRGTLIELKTDSIQFQFEQQLAWKLLEMKPNLIGGITASTVKHVALEVVQNDFPGNEILSAMKFSRNWIERFMKDNDLGTRLDIFELGNFSKYGAS